MTCFSLASAVPVKAFKEGKQRAVAFELRMP
jgi:hypothetical protein